MVASTIRRISMWRVIYALAVITFAYSIYVVIFETVKAPESVDLFPHGELRIGVDASNPPFALATETELLGMEIEIGEALGEYLNIPVRFINIGFDGLYDSINANQVDLLLSQLVVNPIRMGEVIYTRPYFDAGLILVSNSNNPIEDMYALPNHSIAYEFGSDADNELRIWSRRIAEFDTHPYELPQFALDAVRLGQADSALVDAITAFIYMSEHPGWNTSFTYVTNIHYAMAVRIDRGHLIGVINNAIAELMADGTIPEIINRWM